ncbi:Dual specificity mitogen-activated protein kinase kinase 5 [Varanus komodoensis]|nr:Dual specificity mitogen-activated protein kinase kinase 5 [Varanus komodoensis]
MGTALWTAWRESLSSDSEQAEEEEERGGADEAFQTPSSDVSQAKLETWPGLEGEGGSPGRVAEQDVISQVLPDATTTAFEYEDEDGDRITVRSDEEMKAMLSYYCTTVMEQQVHGQLTVPLQIYPRACKPPGKRNIHGLKVNTRAGSANNSGAAVPDSLPANSLKKSSAELKKILANGQMNEQDIRYRDILGHGNGGTVYKANHVLSGKILAVKVIPLDITLELQKQIMSELEILYKCDSSYIIGFYGAFFVENRISLCTEFMDGGSLDVYRKIPEHVLGRIAVAVVKGLTYLWSLKILHRGKFFLHIPSAYHSSF